MDKNIASISLIEGGTYELTLIDVECAKEHFDKFEVLPTGHAWQTIIQSYCSLIKLDTDEVDFDSESDYFFAYAENRNVLDRVSIVINELIENSSVLESILENTDFEFTYSFSINEFIDSLEFNGRNLDFPLELGFYMTFNDKNSVYSVCQIAQKDGYDCLFRTVNPPYYFAGVIKDFAKKELLSRRVNYFNELANEFEGKFEYCQDFARVGSPLKVYATDWKRYALKQPKS